MPRLFVSAALNVGLAAGLALLAHVGLGWKWVLAAAIVAGVAAPRPAGTWGAAVFAGLGVALSWGALLAWNHLRYPETVARMTEAMATIAGGLPPSAIPVLSLVVGVVLGLLGGAIGMGAKQAVRPDRPVTSLPSASSVTASGGAPPPLPTPSA